MRDRYRMYQRNGGLFYPKDRQTGRSHSLATAEQPTLNAAMAKVYLSAQSPKFLSPTWG